MGTYTHTHTHTHIRLTLYLSTSKKNFKTELMERVNNKTAKMGSTAQECSPKCQQQKTPPENSCGESWEDCQSQDLRCE
jgi:hypothetical protein